MIDIRALLVGIIFAFIWASAFTSARIIVADAPPLFALSMRFWVGGFIGIGMARWYGQSMRLTPIQWRAAIIFGVFQNGVYLGLNFVAMQWVEASFASIVASVMPLLVAMAIWLFFREKLSWIGIVGLFVGFIGVSMVMTSRLAGGIDSLGVLLCVIAVFSLTLTTLMIRGVASGGNLLMVVGVQMIIGAVVLLIPALMLESLYDVSFSWSLIAAFSYTVVFAGLIATYLWMWLVDYIGATKAATFHFMNPIFGVSISAFVLSEALSWTDIIGILITSLGIFAVQFSKVTKR